MQMVNFTKQLSGHKGFNQKTGLFVLQLLRVNGEG